MTNEILNHLVQSTVFAAVCALLTLALRNTARTCATPCGLRRPGSCSFVALIALGRTGALAVVQSANSRDAARVCEPADCSSVARMRRVPICSNWLIDWRCVRSTAISAGWAIGSARWILSG